MTPLEEIEDRKALKKTLDCLNKYCQVDAKMNLTLVFRRSFSSLHIEASLKKLYNWKIKNAEKLLLGLEI